MSRAPSRRGALKRPPVQQSTPRSRRLFQFGLLFVGSVLVANALVGERGLIDSIEARRQHQRLIREIDRLHQQNEHLRREARRLREDPRAIEEVARGDLGLIRSGELLFLLHDGPHGALEDRFRWGGTPTSTSPTERPIGCVDRIENRMLACKIVVDDAGWSSPVARWAHNPKVAGSNPAPATIYNQRVTGFPVTRFVVWYNTGTTPRAGAHETASGRAWRGPGVWRGVLAWPVSGAAAGGWDPPGLGTPTGRTSMGAVVPGCCTGLHQRRCTRSLPGPDPTLTRPIRLHHRSTWQSVSG